MTECAATDLSAFNDMWSVFSLPYLWEDGQQACATVMDPAVREMLEADAEANGWQELAKHFSLTEHFTIPDPVFVSKVWFDGLSAENQEAVMEAGRKFSDAWNNEIWPEATEAGMKEMKAQGVEIVEVDKEQFKAAVKPVVDKFLAGASDEQKVLYELLLKTRENY